MESNRQEFEPDSKPFLGKGKDSDLQRPLVVNPSYQGKLIKIFKSF